MYQGSWSWNYMMNKCDICHCISIGTSMTYSTRYVYKAHETDFHNQGRHGEHHKYDFFMMLSSDSFYEMIYEGTCQATLRVWVALCHYKGKFIDIIQIRKFVVRLNNFIPKNIFSIKLILQFNKKCSSSSITSHIRHFPSTTGVLGLVCWPLSIARVCELQRNFEIASRYWSFLTWYIYILAFDHTSLH